MPANRGQASRSSSAAAVAAVALLIAAIGFGTAPSSAIENPKQRLLAKKPAIKGPAIKGPGIAPGARVPRQPMLGPGTPMLTHRPAPNVAAPNANSLRSGPKGPLGSAPGANVNHPGARALNANPNIKGPNARQPNPALAKGDPRSLGPRPFNPGTKSFNPRSPAFSTNRDSRFRAVNAATPFQRQAQRTQHRASLLVARARIPYRPFPGDRNFTGVPPAGETRFVSTEVVIQVGPTVSPQAVDAAARRYGLTAIATQPSPLTGGTLLHFRMPAGRGVAEVVRSLEAERIGIAQPNYLYVLNQSREATAQDQAPGSEQSPEQYAASKLRLAEAHKLATGKNVLVAIIDSEIDSKHPDLGKAIIDKFDAIGRAERPHSHGTGMVGAIVAHGRLLGIAPGATAVAVRAFSADARQSPQATTRSIVAGLEWALGKGARVINMSFAGPYDPMLQVALKKAAEKGAILIAAAGNAGPKSPPLYPAADPNVIAVTATDMEDKGFANANRGPHVAIAAPGVDVLAAAPEEAYQLTTGTSIATAHISGVVALMIERHPNVDAKTVLEVLTASATKLAAQGRDDQFGWGLVDPVGALEELDARISDAQVAKPAQPSPSQPKPAVAPSAAPAAAAPAATKLPRPGIYMPK